MKRSTCLLLSALVLAAIPASAGPEHKNLQVLPKAITNAELRKMMDGFTEQLGVKCTFCHVLEQYEKDDRPHKADARRMIRLVFDMRAKKSAYFGPRTKDAAITCSTCHRGKAEPELLLTSLLPSINFLPPTSSPGAKPKNLQVLAKTTSAAEVQKVMDGFTTQLGVKCDFCHSSEQAKDDRPHKADARRMMKLVGDLKARRADYFGPKTKETAITCFMCHRGKAEPEAFVP